MARERYQILEIIGSGGMGEVCLADDVMLDRKVALKFITAPGEADDLEQLLVEARAAAALDHPFICSIYEVTTLNGRACIAMEYVRGESLERRLRGGALPLTEALRVSEEIADALDAAHRRRLVHRDLKPANVMLSEDGHVKVMDFGLAARLPHSDAIDQAVTVAIAPTEHLVTGTPAYMAPEQIRGEPADRRSDIFAFGILLCEMVSGNNPFKRASIDATFAAILHDPVATLHNHRPPIPAALEPLATRLLAKDPAARFQSFGDVRSAIRKISADRSSSTSRVPAAIDGAANDASNTLIGRERERTQLLQIFNEATSGCGGLVLLYGDVGVGKTRLAEEALTMARRLGYHTLVGRCHEQQDTPALIAYTEVLEEASRLMPAAAFQQAIQASAPELAKLMPELHRLFPDMAPPMALPAELRQRYLFTNVREFLTRSSRFMPLVIFIDDLQWADESTLQLTQHLAQHLANLPIVVIAAYRDVEVPPVAPSKGVFHSLLDRFRGQTREGLTPQAIKAALGQLVTTRQARSIVLRPFTHGEVQSALAAFGKPNPPARLVQKLADRTGGNPFFVVELFRHLKDEGRLFDARNEWVRDLDLDDVELPDTVRVVLERRITRVSSATLNILSAAALLGHHFEPDLLEEVAEVTSDALTAALHEAEGARVLTGPSGRHDITWRFAHQLTCQMLTAAIPQQRRQRLHLRVADAMTRRDHESRLQVAGIAHHLYWAGRMAEPSRTGRALIAAGDAAYAMYASEEAVQHYRRALEVLQDANGHNDEQSRAVQERLADLLALLGKRGDAMELYEQLNGGYRAARATADQARIARKTGTLYWHAGDRAEAMASYRRALEQISGSPAHIEAAHLYQELGLAAFRSGDNTQAVEWSERALQTAERALTEPGADAADVRTAATTAIAQATNTIGVALARSGQLDAARERIERSLATAQALGLLDVACRAYANLGVVYSSVEPKRAIDVSLKGLDIASQIGAASLQSYIYANLAAAYCALTERCDTEGLEAANAAAALDRELGQLDHLAVPLVVIAQIHQCRGELTKAEETYREALALAERIGEPQLILPCYDGLATIHLDRGDRARAEELMERARQLCERAGLDPDTLLLLPFLC